MPYNKLGLDHLFINRTDANIALERPTDLRPDRSTNTDSHYTPTPTLGSTSSDLDNLPAFTPLFPPALWFIILIPWRTTSLLRTSGPTEAEQVSTVAGWWVIRIA